MLIKRHQILCYGAELFLNEFYKFQFFKKKLKKKMSNVTELETVALIKDSSSRHRQSDCDLAKLTNTDSHFII